MIEIVEVKTKKEIREFVDFPTKLYKGVKQYVHPLRFDEINNFNPKKNASLEECDVQLFLAKQDGKIVANYDRGWDIYPTTKEAEMELCILLNRHN